MSRKLTKITGLNGIEKGSGNFTTCHDGHMGVGLGLVTGLKNRLPV